VRFSLGKSTTEKEIKKVVESTPAIVDRLQAE